jgi:S1-C subfamily serine protease
MKRSHGLFLALCFLWLAPTAFADTIRFQDGTEFPGTVLSKTSENMVLQLPFGTMEVKPGEVEIIQGEGADSANTPETSLKERGRPVEAARRSEPMPPAAILPEAMAGVAAIRSVLENGQEGGASGTIIGPDGTIMTNYHVVSQAKKLFVSLPHEKPVSRSKTQREHEATVVKTRPAYDLALIDIHARTPYYLRLTEDDPAVGSEVQAIGNPLGLATSVSKGIVSAIRTNRELGLEYRSHPGDSMSRREFEEMTWIQTDASINPGNSGGPLLNSAFAVVGINTFGLQLSGDMGLNFSLHAKHVRRFAFGPGGRREPDAGKE